MDQEPRRRQLLNAALALFFVGLILVALALLVLPSLVH
jgi:hypothetical protein